MMKLRHVEYDAVNKIREMLGRSLTQASFLDGDDVFGVGERHLSEWVSKPSRIGFGYRVYLLIEHAYCRRSIFCGQKK